MKLKTALIQLTSTADMAANIAKIETFVKQAAGQRAKLIALPENAFLMEASNPHPDPLPKRERGKRYTQENHPGVAAAAKMASQHGIWLLAGSVSVIPDRHPGESRGPESKELDSGFRRNDEKKTYNRSLLFNPEGKITAQYDKIHLFDVEVGDGQTYRESARILPGDRAMVADVFPSPLGGEGGAQRRVRGMAQSANPVPHASSGASGLLSAALPPQGESIKLGLTICYDLRFPQLYRALAKAGAQILAVPSAFTQVTGEAHWHVLLRARATENACFVIAPAQCGTHPGGRKTYGHSLIVDPWGKILADGGTEEGVVMAEIDLDEVKKVRAKLPSLEHDREFLSS